MSLLLLINDVFIAGIRIDFLFISTDIDTVIDIDTAEGVIDQRIEIEIVDEGEGFCPDVVPDPTLPENIDRPHGRGIMLMRAYLDAVEYDENGKSVRLVMHKK